MRPSVLETTSLLAAITENVPDQVIVNVTPDTAASIAPSISHAIKILHVPLVLLALASMEAFVETTFALVLPVMLETVAKLSIAQAVVPTEDAY